MTISALNVQLNCSLVTKNIDAFAPPPIFGQKFNLITVSVHGTLLYFISLISDKFHTYDLLDPLEMLVGFSVLLSMTPPKDHAVGDLLLVAKLEFIWFICCIFMENSQK